MSNEVQTKLLAKAEMLAMLASGIDPFEITLEKWKRVKKWCLEIEEGKLSDFDIGDAISSSTCALCEIHRPPEYTMSCRVDCYGNTSGMLPCPLAQMGECCELKGSAWRLFVSTKSSILAQHMINTIYKSH